LCVLFFTGYYDTLFAHTPVASNHSYQKEAEVEKKLSAFLALLQNNGPEQDESFIKDNYADHLLKDIPMSAHLNILRDLRKNYHYHSVVEKNVTGNKVTIVIKSPVNKFQQITIETDPKSNNRIAGINVKNYSPGL